MSEYIHKIHNVTVLMYHLVFPETYRRIVFDEEVDEVLKEVCLGMKPRYEVKFLEIGADKDHVHILVQSIPSYSVTKVVRIIKKCDCKGDLQTMPASEEEFVGWGVLDRRVFC